MSRLIAATRRSIRLHRYRGPSLDVNQELTLSQGQRFASVLSGLDLDQYSSGQFTYRSNPIPAPLTHKFNHDLQQIRFRRHDRASAFSKPRPKTKKQRQAYNRKMKKLNDLAERRSAPGSKAGPRRQWIKERKQQLLDMGTENELLDVDSELEYGYEDALIEDIMGNTSHLTSQATPEPVYLGNKYTEFYNKVSDQMQQYRQVIEERSKSENEILDLSTIPILPSDKAISDLLRSYRDLHGTRNKPIGIVMALQHLLSDIGVPTVAFGELSYTALLTCCRTPKEARRIFKLMRDNRHPVSDYSWSILVDIHAKLGDFEGCVHVIEEMAAEGVAPTQAAYTSLLAACYKVCNDGRIPHSIRANAGKVGWSHWQQMRIVGIEADAMAFGAVIRLCSARGQPERAINLLEEMHRFDVKPTTLCFSSALRAVARSHEIGTRFERGWSQKQLRRESFTAHHGKMAREIVIMAENAEVELDDGFVSALMLCAAAAGDSATAKAVFLASEVRKMDHLRTIGSNSHLRQLRGQDSPENSAIEPVNELNGGQTDGTLTKIDYQLSLQDSDSKALASFGEREYGKDTRSMSALLRSCAKALDNDGIGTMWAGKENQGYLCENSLRLINTRWEPSYRDTSIPGESSTKLGINALQRYDQHDREEEPKKGVRKKFRGLFIEEDDLLTVDDLDESMSQDFEDGDNLVGDRPLAKDMFEKRIPGDSYQNLEGEKSEIVESKESSGISTYFDLEEEHEKSALVADNLEPLDLDEVEVFESFYAELKEEAIRNGEDFDLNKEEAKEFFTMMQEEFAEALENDGAAEEWDELKIEDSDEDANDIVDEQLPFEGTDDFDLGDLFNDENDESVIKEDQDVDCESQIVELESHSTDTVIESTTTLTNIDGVNEEDVEKILDLQEALPGMPLSRLKKVLKAFNSTLGNPSLITLVPILRETMPDRLTKGWLKRVNSKTADFAFQKAEEEGMVNTALINSMLQVKTSSASLNDALAFHSNQFKKYKVKPTGYSDRLVLQMLVDNKRMTRALQLKQSIEEQGRTLDIPSYGSIIEYYSKHGQLGSALLSLQECLRQHGAAPSEKYLSKLRTLCKHTNLEIEELIGEDPIQWLKYGEKYLKREMTKKGRKNVKMAYNRAVQA